MIPTDTEFMVGLSGLVSIVTVLFCIALSWWAMQTFRFDLFVKNPKSPQAILLQVFLSIIIGYQIAKFITDYFQWAMLLKWMF